MIDDRKLMLKRICQDGKIEHSSLFINLGEKEIDIDLKSFLQANAELVKARIGKTM